MWLTSDLLPHHKQVDIHAQADIKKERKELDTNVTVCKEQRTWEL